MRFSAAMMGALALACSPIVASAQEQPSLSSVEQQKLQTATRIVQLGYPEERRQEIFFATMDQMVGQMRDGIRRSMPAPDAGAEAIADKWLENYVTDSKAVLSKHIPSLMDGIARGYVSMFTQEELGEILEFVSTDAGQKFFELSPAVIATPSFAAANQAYIDEITASLPAAQADLRRELAEYFSRKDEVEALNES